jgi:hypothetical protein
MSDKGMLEFKEKFSTTRHDGRLANKDKCEGDRSDL